MFPWFGKAHSRRRGAKEQRARLQVDGSLGFARTLFCWKVVFGAIFVGGAVAIALFGEEPIEAVIGQRLDRPIYARIDFQVEDQKQTAAARRTAQAMTPSYYVRNAPSMPFARIRAEILRVYQAAVDAESFEAFQAAADGMKVAVDRPAYDRLRRLVDLPNEGGRAQFETWVESLPLESQYVVSGLSKEQRDPPSAVQFIFAALPVPDVDGGLNLQEILHADLVAQDAIKALRGAAADVARSIPAFELRPIVEGIVLAAFRGEPTLVFDAQRTQEAMQAAANTTPMVMTSFAKGRPLIEPGIVGSAEFQLLKTHRDAYLSFLRRDTEEARELRRQHRSHLTGLAVLVGALAAGMMTYTRVHLPRVFERRRRTIGFAAVLLGALAGAQAIDLRFPQYPSLVLVPCLFAAMVLPIVYPRLFALGVSAILSVLVATTIRTDLVFLLTLLIGVVVAVGQLGEIRSRTRLITCGAVTALAVFAASSSGGLLQGNEYAFLLQQAVFAAVCASLTSFVVSGLLPFVERAFGIATSLTLLEWRDPTRPLLQLLAREAPGTYNHSLVCGTLAEAACQAIGANGLLAQVGALYHDIGKINKPDYFTENQTGGVSRHDNLAPTMSLLIILGHVKDGLELAREYKLPKVLWSFIGEHHGTTVVKYFHHMAAERAAQSASGRHDREVLESEFRYAGPKPTTPETAVLMLCDGVEGAVRSLPEPTVGRIEGIVHQIVAERLNDGQFDDCDITLRELRVVADSLVKTLCGIYHSRIAYPAKSRKSASSSGVARVERLSG